jgi:SAM-dependent methyltransferase
MTALNIEEKAAAEFNRWARSGRAESMARGHGGFTRLALDRWTLGPQDRVLDVGCGNGWAVREMLARGAGSGVGVDLAPEMIARATPPGEYHVASAAALSHILSVEALYYTPDPTATLAEWRRVARPGARLMVLMDLYAESPVGEIWAAALDVHAHVLSAAGWAARAADAGWFDARTERVRSPEPVTPEAEFELSRYWPDYATYLGYREAGALMLTARAG